MSNLLIHRSLIHDKVIYNSCSMIYKLLMWVMYYIIWPLASFSTIFHSFNQNEKDSVAFEPIVKGPQVSETLSQLATRPMYFTFPVWKEKWLDILIFLIDKIYWFCNNYFLKNVHHRLSIVHVYVLHIAGWLWNNQLTI